jgi:hypothetical protein
LLLQTTRSYSIFSTNPVAIHNERYRPLVERDVLEPFVFPRQRPGIEYDLNWSLTNLQITPYNDSFRNASIRHLIQRAYGKLTKERALLADALPNTEYQRLITYHAEELQTTWRSFAPKFHRRVQREISYYLTHVPSSFVQDGDFGFGVKVRVITDNGTSGLLLRNMLLPSRRVSALNFQADGLVIHAPGFEFTPANIVEEFNGPKPEDLGLTSDKFIMSNENENRIIIGGVFDSNLLLDSIAYVGTKSALGKESIVIPSDSVISKDGKITLIVNKDANDASNVRKSMLTGNNRSNITLYGAQHNMLSKDGLSRVWGGIRTVVDNDTYKRMKFKLGDLVESVDGGKRYIITSKDTAKPNVIKKPAQIVFIVDDSTNSVPVLGKISAETARSLFTNGLSNFPPTDIKTAQQQFTELTSNVPFYVLNRAASNDAFSNAFDSVTSGNVSNATSADSALGKHLEKQNK